MFRTYQIALNQKGWMMHRRFHDPYRQFVTIDYRPPKKNRSGIAALLRRDCGTLHQVGMWSLLQPILAYWLLCQRMPWACAFWDAPLHSVAIPGFWSTFPESSHPSRVSFQGWQVACWNVSRCWGDTLHLQIGQDPKQLISSNPTLGTVWVRAAGKTMDLMCLIMCLISNQVTGKCPCLPNGPTLLVSGSQFRISRLSFPDELWDTEVQL